MSVVGEAALSFLMERIICNVVSLILDRDLGWKHNRFISGMKKLETTFKDLKMVLREAEEKRQGGGEVAGWLDELEYLACDAENVLEEFHLHVLKEEERTSWTCHNYNPTSLVFKTNLEKKLSAVAERLEELVNRKARLDLLGNRVSSTPAAMWRIPSSSMETAIYGRDEEKRSLLKMITTEGTEPVGVIPIVGMGGIGKTALVQWLYNNSVVKETFQIRGWVCVSKEFDIAKLTNAIIEAVTGTHTFQELSMNQLSVTIKLRGNKFLLVLDDYWNDSYNNWRELKKLFAEGAPGSKILLTTRSTKVADIVSTVERYETLGLLSDVDCWRVFCSHASLDPHGNSDRHIEEIGRNITKKCVGLPLAAMTLGGILRRKERIEDWEDVLNSKQWDGRGDEELLIKSVMKMSYYHLSPQLKRCFAMCAIFPREYKFLEKEMVFIWLGAGLVSWGGTRMNPHKNGKGFDIGHWCFEQLVSQSIFLPFDDSRFYVHDFFRDVAREVSSNSYCCWDETPEFLLERTLHLSFTKLKLDSLANKFEGLQKAQQSLLPLRTIYHLDIDHKERMGDTNSDLKLSMFRYIRTLSVSNLMVTEFSKAIRSWKHLRFIDISNSEIMGLPKSITSLSYLEILKLYNCYNLLELPMGIGKLKNLRYLDASRTRIAVLPDSVSSLHNLEIFVLFSCSCLQTLPPSIGGLKSLRYLDLTHTMLSALPPSIASLSKLEYLILNGCPLNELPTFLGDMKNLKHLHVSGGTTQNNEDQMTIPEFSEWNVPTYPPPLSDAGPCLPPVSDSPSYLPLSSSLVTSTSVASSLDLVASSFPPNASFSSSIPPYSASSSDFVAFGSSSDPVDYVSLLGGSVKAASSPGPVAFRPTGDVDFASLPGHGRPWRPFNFPQKIHHPLNKLPATVGNLKQLKRLDLSFSNLTRLPEFVTLLPNLDELNLSFCKEIVELPADIGNLLHLRRLNVSRTNIASLPESATSLSELEVLDLSYCKGFQCLPDDIGNLERLQVMKLVGCGISRLPASTTTMEKLKTLELSECKNLEGLPGDIGRLINLKILNMRGCILEELPESIKFLENLELLDVRNCDFLGVNTRHLIAQEFVGRALCTTPTVYT